MDNKTTDISLIRKYLNGELDATAMHQLERRALDDPFLMDALEGYEGAADGSPSQVDELNSRLQQRATKKEGRIISFSFMATAASIIAFLTVGGIWLYNKQPATSIAFVKNVKKDTTHTTNIAPAALKPEKQQETAIFKQAQPIEAKPYYSHIPKSKIVVEDAQPNAPILKDEIFAAQSRVEEKKVADTTPVNEMIAMSFSKKKVVTPPADKNDETKPLNTLVQSKVEGASITPKLGSSNSAAAMAYMSSLNIRGVVIDKTDNLPMPGVSVKVLGTNKVTLTNKQGYFNLPADSTGKTKLVIASTGYQTAKINAQRGDSLKTIALSPANRSLNEVVVGYGAKKESDGDVSFINAHPKEGWKTFYKYLKDNANSPDGIKGTVTLSFVVAADGTISETKITKSLSPPADKKAVELVNNGSDWIGNTNGHSEKVTLKIKFEK